MKSGGDEKSEYAAFLSATEVMPPDSISRSVRDRVARDIAPSLRQVGNKVTRIHISALLVTLTVCPQFGLGPLGGGHGVMHYVMDYGPFACASLCAAVFFCTSGILNAAFSSAAERRVLQQNAGFLTTLVVGMSVVAFMFMDGVTATVEVPLFDGVVWAVVGAAIYYIMSKMPLKNLHATLH